MQFASTRDAQQRVGFSEALARGLASGGGLYVPLEWPAAAVAAVKPGDALARQAGGFLAPFAQGDRLADDLPAVCAEAFDFPAPLVPLDGERLGVLELFHGPTAAFKDFGARFLAAALSRLRRGAARTLTILVATSGDTGGAVAAAFHRQPGIEVVVLFPKGQVSPTQQQQLTCWGENVRSLAVRGSFDDCQRLVKQAFLDPALAAQWDLSSANSINLGRLLPQAVYYAATSVALHARTGAPASFIIPSGNLGNATACVWARRLGAPIAEIVLAHNANRTVPDYLDEGVLRIRASVATLASAMDVGNPSNLERLTALYPDAAALRLALSAVSVDDGAIRARIRADHERFGALWCPHTAVAAEAFARLDAARRHAGHWVLVATAHPAKFREIVEPLVGRPVPVPESLERLFRRPSRFSEIDATLDALRGSMAERAA
ncbi:MAG TPA: threonine synthase [Steroidobacteraceae bacterium]|nr:threonine synthase [Steroidobacteraceae bacterium]